MTTLPAALAQPLAAVVGDWCAARQVPEDDCQALVAALLQVVADAEPVLLAENEQLRALLREALPAIEQGWGYAMMDPDDAEALLAAVRALESAGEEGG